MLSWALKASGVLGGLKEFTGAAESCRRVWFGQVDGRVYRAENEP